MSHQEGKSAVILDIDGVVNSFSNCSFYANFIYSAMRNLSKIRGRKKLIQAWPKINKYGGANALFKFARIYAGNEKKFDEFARNLINDLNFDDIPYDPSIRSLLKRLSKYGDIIVRSDGLTSVAAAVWLRVLENRPAAEIKKQLFSDAILPKNITLEFEGKKINISGIEDNNMSTKTDIKSWHIFANKYNIDLTKSVLLDDSKHNSNTAEKLGMKAVSISKLDSFLHKSIFNRSLADVLGAPMTAALHHYKIAYGPKVDMALLFSIITDYPKKLLQGEMQNFNIENENRILKIRNKLTAIFKNHNNTIVNNNNPTKSKTSGFCYKNSRIDYN